MDISELITIIREDYLDDTFSGWESATEAEKADQFLWSDSALYRYITEAQKQACMRTDFLYDDVSFTITMVSGSPSYTIDTGIIAIENVEYNNSKNVKHMSVEDFKRTYTDWRTASGMENQDLFYTIRGRKLRVYPIPDSTDADNTISIEAWRLPSDSITSSGDDLEIPEEFHRDLILWVLHEAFNKRDAETYDPGKSSDYLAQFNQRFGTPVSSEVRLNQLQEDSSLIARPDVSSSDQSDEDWP